MSTAVATTGFTQDAFDTFLAARNEPAWLKEMRRESWHRFEELPMPSVRDEEWMRTDIRLFKLDRFGLPSEPTAPADASAAGMPHALLAAGVDLAGRQTTFDSRAAAAELARELSDQGVLFGSLDALVAEHGEVLRPFFERRVVDPFKDKFSALQAAVWTGGTLLYVPKNVRIDQPLHALSALGKDGVDLNRTLVILEEGAEATMLSETASVSRDAAGLHCGGRRGCCERRKCSGASGKR